jgi:hypothetical protein
MGGDPSMGDPSMMNGGYTPPPATDISAIKIKAYGLISDVDAIWSDELRENIKVKSTLFMNENSEDVTVTRVVQGDGNDNVLAFTMYLKLKNPIKMDE